MIEDIEALKRRLYEELARVQGKIAQLRGSSLPKTLESLLDDEQPTPLVTADMLFLPKEKQDAFRALRGTIFPYLDMVLDVVDAIEQLDSPDKVRTYFEGELLADGNRFVLMDERVSMPGSDMQELYKAIRDMSRLEGLSPEQTRKLKDALEHWHVAALDVIRDQQAFYTKTKSGNPGTTSEYFGSMVLSAVNLKDSTTAVDGRYAGKLRSAIRYDDIVHGRITKADPLTHEHQSMLLSLYHRLQDPQKESKDFWTALKGNRSFLPTYHKIAVREGYEDANDVFLEVLEQIRQEFGDEQFGHRSLGTVWRHFDGKTAYDQFVSIKKPEIDKYFGRDDFNLLFGPPLLEWGTENLLVVLTSYEEQGPAAAIRYVTVNGGYREHTLRAPGVREGIAPQVAALLMQQIDEHMQFLREYERELSNRKGLA